MKRGEVEAIFLLAGIEIKGMGEIENRYWPDHPNYNEMREKYPWWTIEVEGGYITIGWRKRVIAIDWSFTNRRGIITEDEVTKDDSSVHAWSLGDAVNYLRKWMSLPVVDVTTPGHKNYLFEGKEKVIEGLKTFINFEGAGELVHLRTMVKNLPEETTIVMSVQKAGELWSYHLRVGAMDVHHYPRGK